MSFLRPRNGRGLAAKCPRQNPVSRPCPCPVRDRVQSESRPHPRRDRGRVQSATATSPRPIRSQSMTAAASVTSPQSRNVHGQSSFVSSP